MDDLYPTVCVGSVLKMLKFPDGSTRIVCQGLFRARLVEDRPDRALPDRPGRALGGHRRGRGRARRPGASRQPALPADGRPEPAGARGAAGRRDEHARAGPAGRPARLEPAVHDRGEAEAPGRDQRPGPAREAGPVPRRGSSPCSSSRARSRSRSARRSPRPSATTSSASRSRRSRRSWARARRITPSSTSSGSGSEGQAPGRGPDRGRARDRAAGGDAPELGRVLDRPDLSRLAGRPPVEQVEPRPARPAAGPEGPRHRPLRPREDQGTDPRIPGRPQAEEGHEGADPLLRRPAGHGQDLAGQEHRQGARARVRPDQPGRRARRGRDPRPPPHLRRRACPAGSSRESARPGRTTRSSCSTRSTSSAPTSAATPRPRSWKCSTPSRTRRSATITWTSISTSRR